MAASTPELRAPLGYARAETVLPDEERPGLLRARTLSFDTPREEAFQFPSFPLHDGVDAANPEPGLVDAGFETVDLSMLGDLQRVLAAIRDEDRVSDENAEAVRASLQGARLALADGSSLRVEHVADAGLIHRRAGPNGLDVNPGGMDGANGHGGATGIHADQDVFGTPLKQMMKGGAPQLFRHRTPDGRNDEASMFLLNLWIPIQQITRPLVLMDRRTLDARRHQLRYGLPVTSFLDRDEETSINDIWVFLPDPGQRWHFRSNMGPDQGYLFDTLGEPHGACILPGEDALEALSLTLGRACDAIAANDRDGLREATGAARPALPDVTTAPVRDAWRRMTALLDEAAAHADGAPDADWVARAERAQDAIIRKSIEMRLVAQLVVD